MTGDTSSVTYDYTPFSAAPEPAAFLPVLLAIGLFAARRNALDGSDQGKRIPN
jgi:hypothetical protein